MKELKLIEEIEHDIRVLKESKKVMKYALKMLRKRNRKFTYVIRNKEILETMEAYGYLSEHLGTLHSIIIGIKDKYDYEFSLTNKD